MKCPKCNVDLIAAVRHKLKINSCPSCQGMWFEHDELAQLEDEAFDFGEHAKGTLVVDAAATTDKCPQCGTPMNKFRYRFYDLEMEVCKSEHGYWLEHDEDTRVLDLMKIEERDMRRTLSAEQQWAKMLQRMRSRSFFSKLKDLFHH